MRTDLHSQSSSEELQSPDPTLEARFHEQLKQAYVDSNPQLEPIEDDILRGADGSNIGPPPGEHEEAYEFRLFAKPSGSGPLKEGCQGLQRIALRSPTPVNREPGFVEPLRPEAFHFTGITSAEQVERYQKAAVSGEEILKGMNVRWVC